MTKRILLLGALAISSVILFAGVASANRLSINERGFELIWNSGLTNKTRLVYMDEHEHRISCNLTLLGRFTANTIAKNTTANQGTINHGEIEGCQGGTATIKTETMPWQFRYRSFSGTLPNGISAVSFGLIGAQFRTEASGISCEPITEVEHPAVGILENFSGGAPENIRADETASIPSTGFICSFGAGNTHFSGISLIRNLPRTAKITVTLI